MSLSRASRVSRRVKLWLHCHALEGCFLFLLCVPLSRPRKIGFGWKRPKRDTKRDSRSFDRDGTYLLQVHRVYNEGDTVVCPITGVCPNTRVAIVLGGLAAWCPPRLIPIAALPFRTESLSFVPCLAYVSPTGLLLGFSEGRPTNTIDNAAVVRFVALAGYDGAQRVLCRLTVSYTYLQRA
ncbi:hypothetical protein BD310DRAFT_928048 [Dichomitus squalens]|uniref:Uncharacterized protein n=1 Tax=Dichomitus squalens TaxID=114155 RepID=A0A4Q9PU10_9APHY|nr:hypothetical protein BD310DRAFT_928048 [Dichomitus squalens]